jgi:uncharacterized surface protein with fasciclin (FAS1) repeats
LLQQVLPYHIIPSGALTSSELKSGQKLETLLPNSTVTVNVEGGRVNIDDASLVTPDIKAGRSIIRIINQVMFPPPA